MCRAKRAPAVFTASRAPKPSKRSRRRIIALAAMRYRRGKEVTCFSHRRPGYQSFFQGRIFVFRFYSFHVGVLCTRLLGRDRFVLDRRSHFMYMVWELGLWRITFVNSVYFMSTCIASKRSTQPPILSPTASSTASSHVARCRAH